MFPNRNLAICTLRQSIIQSPAAAHPATDRAAALARALYVRAYSSSESERGVIGRPTHAGSTRRRRPGSATRLGEPARAAAPAGTRLAARLAARFAAPVAVRCAARRGCSGARNRGMTPPWREPSPHGRGLRRGGSSVKRLPELRKMANMVHVVPKFWKHTTESS